MQRAYLVDVGILLAPDDEEFEAYAVSYDRARGYYDENQYYCLNRERAILEAQDHVVEGDEGTYGIVTGTWLDDDITNEDLENGNVAVDNEEYLVEDVIFAAYKVDGEAEELTFVE